MITDVVWVARIEPLADGGYSIPRKSIQCQYIGIPSISWQLNLATLSLIMPSQR
jgi:hypothetical protein